MSRYQATTNPTTTNDSANGYVVGSVVTNTATNSTFVCNNNTTSSAIWKTIPRFPFFYWSAVANGNPTTGQIINGSFLGTRTGGFPTYSGTPSYWVQITNATGGQTNRIEWVIPGFDFTKDFRYSVCFFQNGGSSSQADGVQFGVGGSSTFTSNSGTANNSLCFQYNTFTNNNMQFYQNGSAVGVLKTFVDSGSNYYNQWVLAQMVVRRVGSTRVAYIINGGQPQVTAVGYVCTSWTPGGQHIFVGARTGASSTDHYVQYVTLEYI